MKKKSLYFVAFVVLMAAVMVSCSNKDDDTDDQDSGYNDLSTNVRQIIPESVYQTMIDLGMPVYLGNTPPNFENTYLVSPFILDTSNISYDYPGKLFADMRIKYFNQNNTDFTVEINYINGPEQAEGIGGFISGSGNNFTVFALLYVEAGIDSADIAIVASGVLTVSGIQNFYYANFMVDNHGNQGGYFIENNEGRLIHDDDGMSEITDDLVLYAVKSALPSINQK